MDYKLNDNDRLQLQKMIKTNDVEDQTSLIRTAKHSNQLKDEVDLLNSLKKEFSALAKSDPLEFENLCISKCSFLFERYTDIYNKVFKDEIDLAILDKFLGALRDIEEGRTDQHEASVRVGKYLKELYVDSALKKTEKNDLNAAENHDSPKEARKINWEEYKSAQANHQL
jgi:hypothetical protein